MMEETCRFLVNSMFLASNYLQGSHIMYSAKIRKISPADVKNAGSFGRLGRLSSRTILSAVVGTYCRATSCHSDLRQLDRQFSSLLTPPRISIPRLSLRLRLPLSVARGERKRFPHVMVPHSSKSTMVLPRVCSATPRGSPLPRLTGFVTEKEIFFSTCWLLLRECGPEPTETGLRQGPLRIHVSDVGVRHLENFRRRRNEIDLYSSSLEDSVVRNKTDNFLRPHLPLRSPSFNSENNPFKLVSVFKRLQNEFFRQNEFSRKNSYINELNYLRLFRSSDEPHEPPSLPENSVFRQSCTI